MTELRTSLAKVKTSKNTTDDVRQETRHRNKKAVDIQITMSGVPYELKMMTAMLTSIKKNYVKGPPIHPAFA